MTQTLLAVLALGLLGLLSLAALGERNAAVSDHARSLVREEARGVAAGVLERVTALPFRGAADPDAGGPDSGGSLDDVLRGAAALDGLDGLDSVRVEVPLEDPVRGLPSPLVFSASFRVEPVALDGEAWRATPDPSSYKRVTLDVRHDQTGQRVVLERVYADLDDL